MLAHIPPPCTLELCNEYRREEMRVSASLFRSAVLGASNDTRYRRTSVGIPCNRMTCREEYRHWGCTEDMCTGVDDAEESEVDNSTLEQAGETGEDAEWLAAHTQQTALMPTICRQWCTNPTEDWRQDDRYRLCPMYAPSCRELLRVMVRLRSCVLDSRQAMLGRASLKLFFPVETLSAPGGLGSLQRADL
jgi:hypothetical protein